LDADGAAPSDPTGSSAAGSNCGRADEVLRRLRPDRERVQVPARSEELRLRHQLPEDRTLASRRRDLRHCVPTSKTFLLFNLFLNDLNFKRT
jgi:hypothetical protein